MVHRYVADISIKEDVIRLADQIASIEHNGIQLLVNNAGIALDHATRFGEHGEPLMSDAQAISNHFMRSTPSDWSKSFETNVMGGFFMSMAFLPLLEKGSGVVKGHSSSIINMSSNSAFLKDSCRGYISYAASKAGTVHLSRMLATLLAKTSVRLNQIAPGTFPSEVRVCDIDERFLQRFLLMATDDYGLFRPRSEIHHEPSSIKCRRYVESDLFPFFPSLSNVTY
jgi:NAD(P)-dependent dehydrogenase (short-subunit alcohol dehydrogenase family)